MGSAHSLRLDQMSFKRGRKMVGTEKGKSQGREGFSGNILQVLERKWSTTASSWLSTGDVQVAF